MASVGEIIVRINGDNSGLNNALSDSQNKMKKIGGGLSKAGKSLTMGLTAPILGIAGGIAKISMDFEAGMSKVAAVSGATGKDLETLKQKAKDMGKSTQFSATQSAEAMNFMGMAGWDTTQIMGGLDGIMNLAAASGEDLGLVSDIVTDSMTAFGMKAEESGKFADLLATASSSANTNVAMLGESFKYAAPVAGALGFSAKDTALSLSLMANAGIKSSMSGTSLRSIMTRLVKPTKESSGAMKRLGIDIKDSNGKMKPFNTIMKDLRKSFKKLTPAQKASEAAALGGKTAMGGLLAVVNTSDDDFNKLEKALDNSTGSAKKMADVMNKNVAGQMKKLKSALEGVAIELGNILLPILNKIVTKGLLPMVKAFSKLSPGMKTFILVSAGILAALGPVMAIIGGIVTNVGLLSTGIGIVTAFFGWWLIPIAAIIAILVLVGVAIMDLWNNNEEFRTNVKGLWLDIQNAIGAVVKKITEFWEEWGPSITLIFTNIWKGLKRVINDALKDWRSIFKIGSALLEGDFETAFEEMKNIVVRKMGLAQDAIRAAIKLTQDLYNLQIKMAKTTDELGLAKSVATSGVQGISRVAGKKQGVKGSSAIVFNTGKQTKQSNIEAPRGRGGYRQGYANGTINSPGGMTLVGERGPELINLPKGSQVFSNQESKNMISKDTGDKNSSMYISGIIKVDTGNGIENLSSKAIQKIVADSIINNKNRYVR